MALIPTVPQDGSVPLLPEPALDGLTQSAADAIAKGDQAAIRGLIRDAEALQHISDDPALMELSQVLRLTGDRLAYADAPVTDLLDQAQEMEEGPLRDAVLQNAQDALLDRASHMAEMLAGSKIDQEERESARTWVAANAKRLSQLLDDAQGRFDDPSAASRLFAGLSAASQALDAGARGDITGSETAQILQDIGDALPSAVSPVAPFAGPMGAVAAQLDSTRSGFELAAEALDGVSDAIGGDASGLDRAQVAAQRLESQADRGQHDRRLYQGRGQHRTLCSLDLRLAEELGRLGQGCLGQGRLGQGRPKPQSCLCSPRAVGSFAPCPWCCAAAPQGSPPAWVA